MPCSRTSARPAPVGPGANGALVGYERSVISPSFPPLAVTQPGGVIPEPLPPIPDPRPEPPIEPPSPGPGPVPPPSPPPIEPPPIGPGPINETGNA